jgi:hypothetical protein
MKYHDINSWSRRRFLKVAGIVSTGVANLCVLSGWGGGGTPVSLSQPILGPPRRDRREWRRKHDDVIAEPPWVPEGRLNWHWYPTWTGNVSEILKEPGSGSVRAAGSGWSLSAAVCDQNYSGALIETTDLNLPRIYVDIIPDCLSPTVRGDLYGQPLPAVGSWDESVYNLVHVSGGMRIYELYSWLDRQSPGYGPLPNIERQVVIPWWERNDPLRGQPTQPPQRERSWALPTMGGAGGQTIAGAISTSTHGGDEYLPPIADAVVAIELMGARGSHFWIQRKQFSDTVREPLCIESRVAEKFNRRINSSPIEVISDDDALAAALVAVGRMGVIISVVIRVVEQFGLHHWRRRGNWSQIRSELLNPADPNVDVHQHRFLQVAVNPLPRFDSEEHTCWVENRDAVPLPSDNPLQSDNPPAWQGRAMRTGENAGKNVPVGSNAEDFFNKVCSSDFKSALDLIAKELDKIRSNALLAEVGFLLLPIFPPGTGLVAALAIDAVRKHVISLKDGNYSSLGDVMAELCNWLVANGHSWALLIVVEVFLNFGLPAIPRNQPRDDYSYAVMDRHNYRDMSCITNANSIEVAFGGPSVRDCSVAAVQFIEKTIFPSVLASLGRGLAMAGYISMRWTARTSALIGIQQWPHTCIIEISGLKRVNGVQPLLHDLVLAAIQAGGTVHWGQWNEPLTRDAVQNMYGKRLERWRFWLSKFDPEGMFSTDFTKKAGLEP